MKDGHDPDINIVSPENLREPYPLYRKLQASDPVHWSEPVQAWFITRHEDVANLFRDPRLSAARTELFVEHQLRGLDASIMKDYLDCCERMMLMSDGAQHTRLRRRGNAVFSTQTVESWRPLIRKIVDELLDRIQDTGRLDAVADLSSPLPALAMAEIYNIPAADRDDFQRWGVEISRFFGASLGNTEEDARAANQAVINLVSYLGRVIQERRRNPGNDMLSLLNAYEEEGQMDSSELIANAVLILNASHVTTIDQLSSGIYDLLSNPEQLQALRQHPELLPSAVEEILRYSPAVPFMHRIATTDIEIYGKTIKKGQLVFLGMAAANRDPKVFPNPDRFDITRANNKHLSFAFGPHLCLGAGLARRELEIGVEALLRRMPGLRFDEKNPPQLKYESLVFRGFHSLPLVF
jgi:cytochrome P450